MGHKQPTRVRATLQTTGAMDRATLPSHTTPFHSYFTNPHNGISFHTTPFRSIPPDSINPNKALVIGESGYKPPQWSGRVIHRLISSHHHLPPIEATWWMKGLVMEEMRWRCKGSSFLFFSR
jgi:hypothetical protein